MEQTTFPVPSDSDAQRRTYFDCFTKSCLHGRAPQLGSHFRQTTKRLHPGAMASRLPVNTGRPHRTSGRGCFLICSSRHQASAQGSRVMRQGMCVTSSGRYTGWPRHASHLGYYVTRQSAFVKSPFPVSSIFYHLARSDTERHNTNITTSEKNVARLRKKWLT